MSYKSNYEPYTSQSLYSRQSSSSELLYPLGDLYPHVVALQLQMEDENEARGSASRNLSYHQDIPYWAEVASPESPHSLSESFSKRSLRRYSGSSDQRLCRYPEYLVSQHKRIASAIHDAVTDVTILYLLTSALQATARPQSLYGQAPSLTTCATDLISPTSLIPSQSVHTESP
ncbi:hypothetical protein AN2912.2 [Aspergillus nidulans FGSC A4]|nr:hypothetical protein AN2912.2 [Aspergillus nidulans FGSC A4]|eukprot:XP_660516.1 hypothetical protein AN2912.2 [Aspergillus nidulans FGSC A4]